MDLSWWSIEVRDDEISAWHWRSAWSAALVEAALAHGAREWEWHDAPFGVVLEIGFADPDAWDRFRHLPVVTAALDAVPARSLYVYPGRGGSSGAVLGRHPRPVLGAGSAPLPEEPEPVVVSRTERVDLLETLADELTGTRRVPVGV